jgi:hypothetical protein
MDVPSRFLHRSWFGPVAGPALPAVLQPFPAASKAKSPGWASGTWAQASRRPFSRTGEECDGQLTRYKRRTNDPLPTVFKERIFLDKSNPSILHNEITTTDNSLTPPRTVMKNYKRETKNITWEENNCVEGNTYITINKQVYFLAADSNLMPSRKDQRRRICDISISRESDAAATVMRSRPQAATPSPD